MQLIYENDQPEEQPLFPEYAEKATMEPADENPPAHAESEKAVRPDAIDSAANQKRVPTRQVQRAMPSEKQQDHPKQPEQISMFSSDDDLLTALQDAGFICIDNRKKSGILWVLFDGDKEEELHELERQHIFKAVLERRGARATHNVPAWRIQMKQ